MSYTQEMPPEGGFGKVHYQAVRTKRWVSNKKLAAGIILAMIYGGYRNNQARRKMYYEDVIDNDALIAMEPFLAAERDRHYLRVLWKNREMETNLMKDVPGWVPGTFFGVPYFKTLGEDKLIPECMGTFNMFVKDEWYRHADPQKQGLSRFKLA